jgi:hypothetical protein
MKKVFRQEMTKNWPGGRRKAKIGNQWNYTVLAIPVPRTENKNIVPNSMDDKDAG